MVKSLLELLNACPSFIFEKTQRNSSKHYGKCRWFVSWFVGQFVHQKKRASRANVAENIIDWRRTVLHLSQIAIESLKRPLLKHFETNPLQVPKKWSVEGNNCLFLRFTQSQATGSEKLTNLQIPRAKPFFKIRFCLCFFSHHSFWEITSVFPSWACPYQSAWQFVALEVQNLDKPKC